jgi:porphobilinogen synthase
MRRLRALPSIRRLVRESRLSPADLIQPLFVVPGTRVRREVASMPGVHQASVDETLRDCRAAREAGVMAVILFGLPEHKDPIGSASWRNDGIVQRAAQAIRKEIPDLLLIADLCLCEYTDHGHCGSLTPANEVDNDKTIALLARQAVSLAGAGAQVIAPSGMMDGMVAAIRAGLDENGFEGIPILSYAAKYASGFYGPFRDAADSAPRFGDRRSYQMDPANGDEALREVGIDLAEGADIVMVKPALPYLDIIRRVKDRFRVPVAAYQVSGEYAMIKAAARNGWIDEERVAVESLVSIRRAGADMILSYYATSLSPKLKNHDL